MEQHLHLKQYDNADIFDALDELVYIIDITTDKILYINNSARNYHNCTKDNDNDKIAAFKSHCKITAKRNGIWNVYNELDGRYFQYKKTNINFKGCQADLIAGFEITKYKTRTNELSLALDMEKMVTEQVAKLSSAEDLPKAINELLLTIGTHMEADRAYIFELFEDFYSNTYEWCAEGVTPQIDNLKYVSLDDARHWTRILEKSECILVENIEDIKYDDPEEYELLKMQDITSCVEAPICRDGKLIGFIGVDNASAEKNASILYLLKAMGYFLSITMQNAEQRKYLESLSFQDNMTGVNNRNAYNMALEGIKTNYFFQHIGYAICDLNGLKQVNDYNGHQAGDVIIRNLARCLIQVFGKDNVYRIGGDEFAIISRDVSKDEFEASFIELDKLTSKYNDLNVSIGTVWCEGNREPKQMMRLADEKMYATKRKYYEETELQPNT